MHILLIVARLAMAEGGIGAVVVDNAVNGIFGDDRCGGLVVRALPFNVLKQASNWEMRGEGGGY